MNEFLGVPLDWMFGLVVVTVFAAGFMRGFVGFGAALIIVPVLSLVFGPKAAVAMLIVIDLPGVLQLLPVAVRHAERAIVLPITIMLVLVAPIGGFILVSVDPKIMKIAISCLVICMVVLIASGGQLRGQVKIGILLAAGALAGLVQGAAGIGGPPVVAVALARPGDPFQQRANVIGVMSAVALAAVPTLLFYGLFTWQVIKVSLVLIPIYMGAVALGSRFFATGGQKHFRLAALGVLAAVGVATLATASYQYWLG